MFHEVQLEINTNCNRRCPHCPNSTSSRPHGRMDEELFHKIIGELAQIRFGGCIAYHFYGEPLLDKRLPDLVRYTKQALPAARAEVYTNGDLLSIDVFRDLCASGVDNFVVTQHDNLMLPHLQALQDGLSGPERTRLAIRFASDRKMINRAGLVEKFGVPGEPLKVPCTWALFMVVVTYTGNVVLCCNDYFETEVLGNLRTQSLREVWCTPRYKALRKALAGGDRTVSELCSKCDFVPSAEDTARLTGARPGGAE